MHVNHILFTVQVKVLTQRATLCRRSLLKENAPSKAGVVFPVEVPKRASGNLKQVCGEQLRKWMYVLGIDSCHEHDEVGALKCFVTY